MDIASLLRLLNENAVEFVVIEMKEAAGRAQDMQDLAYLRELKRCRSHGTTERGEPTG